MEQKEYDIVAIRGNLSQEEFASQLGISRELVSKMENGKMKLSKATKILLDNFQSEENTSNNQLHDDREVYEKIQSGTTPLLELIAANKKLADAHYEMALAHKQLAMANNKHADSNAILIQKLDGPTVYDHEETELSQVAKFAALLEVVAEIGTGKGWKSKEEGLAVLHKRVYDKLEKTSSTGKLGKNDSRGNVAVS